MRIDNRTAAKLDGSGLEGDGLEATHDTSHAVGYWIARDNQKLGVLRYLFRRPIRLSGLAL
ncbi:MAG: hypothetical protein MI919_38635 [Holophagales bacterium]|nr:hypothetical protein [Holophagales bacterium]